MPPSARTLLLSTLALFPGSLAAQFETPDQVRLFLDCQRLFCDLDFYRREVPFVSFVRTRQDAEVHVLITSQETGGGGREFQLNFIGLRRFDGLTRTLRTSTGRTETEDEERRTLARTLKLGLMWYVADSPAAQRISIEYEGDPEGGPTVTTEQDGWNFWVFRIGASGSLNGEEREQGYRLSGSVSADRVTEELKLGFEFDGSIRRTEFELTDSTLIDRTHNWEFEGLMVKSLGGHWSVGGGAEVRSSTFSNEELVVQIGPALEFNVFPYSQSSTRSLTFLYTVAVNVVRYEQETIFDKTRETLYDQALIGVLSFVEPWGDAFVRLEGGTFLHDLSKHRIEVGGGMSLRLFRGVSLNMSGSVERTKDQLNLPKGEATDEEVLLRRRELGTNYEYDARVGFSFEFGSIFNNVVNPRFRRF